MYICLTCNGLFSKPSRWQETHLLDTPPYEDFHGCPYCFDDNFLRAVQCDNCSKHIKDDFIELVSGEQICSNCYTVKRIEDVE